MAFSFRRMLSNISYFTKPNEENEIPSEVSSRRRHTTFPSEETNLNFERTEPDSTSKQSLKLPESVRNFGAKKGSFSDTDILTLNTDTKKRRCKKLKLDIKKASRSMMESLNRSDNEDSSNIENTPKHILLNCKSADIFSEKLKKFDFDRSFDISDTDSYTEENIDIDSVTDNTDTEVSGEETTIKMCRKVDEAPSATPESFGDVEDKNEEERMTLLLNYQMKLEKIESFLQKLLTEFQFHIEVSKIFNSKSIATVPTETVPKALREISHFDNISRGVSPWNIIMEKEDQSSKNKLKKQLLSMKENIDNFVKVHFQNEDTRRFLSHQRRSITFDMHKGQRIHKQNKVSIKKKMKHYDFPDLREAMVNLFSTEDERDINLSLTPVLSIEDISSPKCTCKCHQVDPTTPIETNQSISSSLGNFTLDSTTLSAYSETLEEMSYNSFQDSSLYSTLLDKSAVDRLTFYIQVHSIEINCELNCGYESKNNIVFYCQSCKVSLCDEYDVLKHVLCQKHCEKIHFLYKTAYIKKCVATGQEIMPSTVLNPMTMYRDENKIVCFGDAVYACSLCFENFIVGESVLMAHCSDKLHASRKERLVEYFE